MHRTTLWNWTLSNLFALCSLKVDLIWVEISFAVWFKLCFLVVCVLQCACSPLNCALQCVLKCVLPCACSPWNWSLAQLAEAPTGHRQPSANVLYSWSVDRIIWLFPSFIRFVVVSSNFLTNSIRGEKAPPHLSPYNPCKQVILLWYCVILLCTTIIEISEHLNVTS